MFNLNGKRTRDEQDDETASAHEQKRIHTLPLPFRTSPTIKHCRPFSQLKRNAPNPLFTQTITPTDSEDEISPQAAPVPCLEPMRPQQSSIKIEHHATYMIDEEMDLGSPKHKQSYQQLDMDTMMLSPNPSPCSMLPSQISRLGTSESGSGGRLPTPIYGHFRQSTDARVNDSPQQAPSQSSPDEEYEKHMRNRRLPTPISEDEAMDTFDDSSDMTIAPSTEEGQTSLRNEQRPTWAPAKKGKPMFSMGFRAGCEMCKNRVPGHYNHIFR
ncbi:uncharacterized protein KY384_005451 [Bacidia gigantensis]|uniref:uncharacterized protein n=1 Tax=Bacidia gigantensis TaxID=2732470 RepID=UPI001D05BF87|nr:uncharacterized protein KY384_005451 [Bacidia gigantensis]KAG8529969.1 hypothetical protein KY384_005451 [Bacidia gigantensis]